LIIRSITKGETLYWSAAVLAFSNHLSGLLSGLRLFWTPGWVNSGFACRQPQ